MPALPPHNEDHRMTATLVTHPLPLLGAGARRVEVDCPHGTTGVTVLPATSGYAPTDDEAAALAVARHHAEERCACTAALRIQYLTRRVA